MQILLIEDDVQTALYVTRGLSDEQHEVTHVTNGQDGIERAREHQWELLIVDRMLPELDGMSLVSRIRQRGDVTPVLFLTTLGGIDDRVNGLNAGADDYLVKPFALSELVARVAALGRRPRRAPVETFLRFADLELDLLARTATCHGRNLDLLRREFRLLEYLMKHTEQVVTRRMLLENVWDVHFEPNTSVVETHMSRLRSKIDRVEAQVRIHTVRGVGYVIRACD